MYDPLILFLTGISVILLLKLAAAFAIQITFWVARRNQLRELDEALLREFDPGATYEADEDPGQ